MLLERDATLTVLDGAVAAAAAGRGSVALVSGRGRDRQDEPRARVRGRRRAGRARLLLAACDDLMAPRTLGPLRDAAGVAGPLAKAMAGDVDGVFGALLDELGASPPTVLVIEDIHWADDATLDVLGYAARRIDGVGAVLVLTCRDDAAACASSSARWRARRCTGSRSRR